MDIRNLRYFEAVARHSHVTRAAEELDIAQPALSKQISQLEKELQVALFDRIGRNVRLTEAGEALLPHARAILAQVEAARAEMAERVGLQRGRVALGTPPTVGTQLLPQTLAQFNQYYPGIEFRLYEAGVQTLLELLEAGLSDMAIVTLPVIDTPLTVEELFSEELVVVVARAHQLATRNTIDLADLRTESWVLSPKNYELRETTLYACQRAGFIPRVVLDGGEMDMLLHLVAAGVGITLVPRLAVEDGSDLSILHVQDQHLRRSLGLVWRDDRTTSPAARALREFLAVQLRIAYEKQMSTRSTAPGQGNHQETEKFQD